MKGEPKGGQEGGEDCEGELVQRQRQVRVQGEDVLQVQWELASEEG